MKSLFWLSLISQAGLMFIDEFYFHWKRILPRWERLGHPVDTLFFLLPLALAAIWPPSESREIIYVVLSVMSCLVVTKDEWIHRKLASPMEHWIHSLLFVLHPVILISGFWMWKSSPQSLGIACVGILIFGIYQTIFWNYYANRIFKTRLGNY